MLMIRLSRAGTKNKPFYRVVVSESARRGRYGGGKASVPIETLAVLDGALDSAQAPRVCFAYAGIRYVRTANDARSDKW